MPQFRLFTDGIADLNPSDPDLVKSPIITQKQHNLTTPGRKVLDGMLTLYSTTDAPGAGHIGRCLACRAPGTTAKIIGPTTHMARPPGTDSTVATGIAGAAGAALLFGVTGGVFMSPQTPHLGLYGAISAGVMTNIKASAMVQFTAFALAPAAVFGPIPQLVIGVAMRVPGIGVGVQGYIVLQTPPAKPAVLVGWGLGFGISKGVLPVDVFVMSALKKVSTV